MKCPNKTIATAMGILLYNCDKTNNTFAGFTVGTDTISTINGKIADGSVVYLPFLKAADAVAANNEDATTATDGYRQMVVNEARIGITAKLDCVFAETLLKAQRASGALLGYVVTKDGNLIGGKIESGVHSMIKLEVSMPSPFPNGNFANGSNLPNVQVTINFGTVDEVAEWRMRSYNGLNEASDLLEVEVADAEYKTTTTIQLVDLFGNNLSGISDDSDATYIYSDGTARTTSISGGLITFSAAFTSGMVVTIEGSISGYVVPEPIVIP